MSRLSKVRKELLTTMMKESIFEAATSVLCEHGVDGTTMNRVAAAASLAKSSLYDYFQSKDDLLEFVFHRIATPFLRTIEDLVLAQMPAPEKLEAILRTAFDHSTKHRAIIRLLAQSSEALQIRQKSRPRILEAFTAIFEQGITEGSFRPHNPAHTGRMFMGCMAELFELQASSASDEAAGEYVAVLVDAALHGFSVHSFSSNGAP
jgi:TetR/AcrR family transcriptional regulator, cholesterol catabolism regulator